MFRAAHCSEGPSTIGARAQRAYPLRHACQVAANYPCVYDLSGKHVKVQWLPRAYPLA